MQLNDTVAKTLVGPINVVWNAVAADMEGMEMSNTEAIEICIDADRLHTFHSQAANDLIHELCREHGAQAVIKKLAEHIHLV